jgi:hypothetical protein
MERACNWHFSRMEYNKCGKRMYFLAFLASLMGGKRMRNIILCATDMHSRCLRRAKQEKQSYSILSQTLRIQTYLGKKLIT